MGARKKFNRKGGILIQRVVGQIETTRLSRFSIIFAFKSFLIILCSDYQNRTGIVSNTGKLSYVIYFNDRPWVAKLNGITIYHSIETIELDSAAVMNLMYLHMVHQMHANWIFSYSNCLRAQFAVQIKI